MYVKPLQGTGNIQDHFVWSKSVKSYEFCTPSHLFKVAHIQKHVHYLGPILSDA